MTGAETRVARGAIPKRSRFLAVQFDSISTTMLQTKPPTQANEAWVGHPGRRATYPARSLPGRCFLFLTLPRTLSWAKLNRPAGRDGGGSRPAQGWGHAFRIFPTGLWIRIPNISDL